MKSLGLFLLSAIFSVVLAGCKTTTMPEGYTGQIGYISDSSVAYNTQKADFFVLDEIDGHSVRNSIAVTRLENQGRGMHMKPVTIGHEVPIGEHRIRLLGMTHYAAPILAFSNPEYEVAGEISLFIEEDGEYVVKGVLTPDYSAIWIEDMRTGKAVSPKVKATNEKLGKVNDR